MTAKAAPPRVTIALPVYNGERFLRAAVEALLAQTYQDFELIIGDNASTDGTEAIGRSFAAIDSRVRYVRHPRNLGLYGNWNALAALARGELFRWAACDDLSAPESVRLCVEALDRNPAAVMAYPKTMLIDDAGNFVENYEDRMNLTFERARDRFIWVMEHLALCNSVFGVIRTSVLRRLPPLGSYRSSDVHFLAELALHGQFVEVQERLFQRRFHEEASSALKGAALQALYTPATTAAENGVEWRNLRMLTSMVMRAPAPLRDKLGLLTYLLRLAKWRSKALRAELKVALRSSFSLR